MAVTSKVSTSALSKSVATQTASKTTESFSIDSSKITHSSTSITAGNIRDALEEVATQVAVQDDAPTGASVTEGDLWYDTDGNVLYVRVDSAWKNIPIADLLDQDDFSSNSATGVATQQSIKAYVDTQITGGDLDFQGDSGGALSIDLDSETMTIAGGEGIDTSGSSNTLTIAGEDATTSNKGVASFSSDNFSVSSGAVTIKDDGVILGTETTGSYVGTITGGTGVDSTAATSGEGTTHTLSVDLNELSTETTIADADFIAMVDATDDGSGKITFENLEDAIFASVSGHIAITEAGVASMQANSVDSDQYVDGSIDLAHMSVNSVDSDQYVDGGIDLAHMSVNSIDSDQYVDGSIDLAHMSVNSIDSDQYVDGSIDNAHLADDAVDSDEIAAGAIDLAHMSVNSVDSDQYVDGSIDNAHVATGLDAVKIADGSVTNAEFQYIGGLTSAAATLASPTFTGNPIAPTQSAADNSTKIATTAYADTAAANLVDSAPSALNTLNELAAALGDDASFSTTVTNSIATKLPLAGGTMSGNIAMGGNDISGGGTITGTFVGGITGNVTGNASGTAATVTTAAQSAITSLGTLTTLTVDNVIINGTTIGHTGDTDLMTVASGVLTVAGEVDATSLDVSGDADIDGTLEADAVTVNGATLQVVVEDHVGAMLDGTETGLAVSYDSTDNNLDFVIDAAQTTITSLLATDIKIGEDDQTKIDFETADEIHLYAANVEQVYVADNIFGPQSDSDVDLGTTGVRWKDAFVDSITVTGEVDGASLDISGNADVDGTLEADAYTVDGTALNEYIADTVGAMVGSNTESGITVAYQDGDNTLDFTVATLNQDTSGTAAIATTVTITDNESTDEDNAIIFTAGGDVDGGNLGLESDGTCTYNPSTGKITATGFVGALTGDVTGNVTGNTSGTAATVTTAAQSNITSLGTLTTLTVDNVIINGTTIGHTTDTDLITVASGIATVAGEVSMTTLDIGGTNVTSTAAEINLLDALDRGSILYGNSSGATAVLGQGSADQVLTSDGTDIAWASSSAATKGFAVAMAVAL